MPLLLNSTSFLFACLTLNDSKDTSTSVIASPQNEQTALHLCVLFDKEQMIILKDIRAAREHVAKHESVNRKFEEAKREIDSNLTPKREKFKKRLQNGERTQKIS